MGDAVMPAQVLDARLSAAVVILLEHLPGAALLSDRRGHLLAVNTAARGLPNLPKVLDDRWQLQARGADRPFTLERLLAGERVVDLPCTLDGQHLLVTSEVVPLDAGGDAVLCLLRAADADPAQSLRLLTLGRLAAGVAHEFNNILTTIAGFAELALAELEPRHPVFAHLQTIRGASERLTHLTRQLLSHVRSPAPAPRLVRVEDLMDGLDVLARRTLGEDVELLHTYDTQGAEVRVDVPQLEQVVLLLLAHVREVLPHGGQVTLSTRTQVLADPRTATDTRPPLAAGTYTVLELADTTPRDLLGRTRNRLLRPWLERETARSSLAMATARTLLQQNAGHLETGDGLADGTLFCMWLPAEARKQESVPSTPLNHSDWHGEATVLLVEDESSVRRFVADILKLKGYTVLEAGNGAEALTIQAAFVGRIDILLTDVAMPVMDGCDLVHRIRPLRPDMRVIYMSGYAYDVVTQEGMLGAHDAFLAKPFTMRTLLEAMRQAPDADASGRRNLRADR